MYLRSSFAVKCTEDNGDSPVCQADASYRQAENPAAERTLDALMANRKPMRDWGHVQDFVKAMWLMLQQPEPHDYVVATRAGF
jgi:nucleoside-diphosphate-sugar epimerase